MPRGFSPLPTRLGRMVCNVLSEERELQAITAHQMFIGADVSTDRGYLIFKGERVWTLTELESICGFLGLRVSTVIAQAEARITREDERVSQVEAATIGALNQLKRDDFYLAAKTHDDDDDAPLEST